MSGTIDTPIRLDVAVDRLLAVEPTNLVVRAELRSFPIQLRRGVGGEELLDPPSLVDAVFSAIMPRITHPGVLRLDRRQKVLERLEAHAAAGAKDDPVLAGSLRTMRQELRNLSLLRRHRDRLIEG